MEYQHSMSSEELDLLIMLTDVVKCEFQKSMGGTGSLEAPAQYFLQDLLDSDCMDDELIQERAGYLFKTIRNSLFVLAFRYIHIFRDSNALSYLVERISNLLPGSRGLVYNNMIVILLMTNEADVLQGSEVRETLGAFLHDNDMVCGISREFHNIAQFRRHFEQASCTIKIGSRLFPQTPKFIRICSILLMCCSIFGALNIFSI